MLSQLISKLRIELACKKGMDGYCYHCTQDTGHHHWWVPTKDVEVEQLLGGRPDWAWHLWSQFWEMAVGRGATSLPPVSVRPFNDDWGDFLVLLRFLVEHGVEDGPLPQEVVKFLVLK